MCRLIGAISTTEIDCKNFLVNAPQSLLRQSHVDARRKQGDGWGVGWFTRSTPKVFKSAHPMYRDRARVLRAARQAQSQTLIAHVRWASNPLKLKRDELIGTAHTQPFSHGSWIFAHNGTLFIPKQVAAELGPWKKYLRGKNDSEVLFYWFLKYFAKTKNPAEAVRQSLKGIDRIWAKCKKSFPIHPYPYQGLNWVLSNGKTLYAFCYADPRGLGPSRALCDRKQCYYQLRRRVTNENVVVASEPLDKATGWENFRHGELLVAERQKNRIVTRRTKVA